MPAKRCLFFPWSDPWLQPGIGIGVAVLAFLLLLFIAWAESGRMQQKQTAQHAHAIETGAALYQLHCRTCHGARGEGVGQLGPALSDRTFFTQRLTDVGWQGTLRSFMDATAENGRLMATRPMYAGDGITAVMPPWLIAHGGPLRSDQIRNITDFILNWEQTAMGRAELVVLQIPSFSGSDPAAIERGRAAYKRHCAACHSIDGVAQAEKAGPDLTHIARVAATRQKDMSAEDYIRRSFLLPAADTVQGFDQSKLGYTCGGVLGMRQFDEIVAFLLTRN